MSSVIPTTPSMSEIANFSPIDARTSGRAFFCYRYVAETGTVICLAIQQGLSPLPPLKVQGDRSLVDISVAVAHRWREGPLLRLREGLRIELRAFGVLHRQVVQFAIYTDPPAHDDVSRPRAVTRLGLWHRHSEGPPVGRADLVHLSILWSNEHIGVSIRQRRHRLRDLHVAHAPQGVADFAWHQRSSEGKALAVLDDLASEPFQHERSIGGVHAEFVVVGPLSLDGVEYDAAHCAAIHLPVGNGVDDILTIKAHEPDGCNAQHIDEFRRQKMLGAHHGDLLLRPHVEEMVVAIGIFIPAPVPCTTTRVKLPSFMAPSSNTRNASMRSRLGRCGEELTAFARSSRCSACSRTFTSSPKARWVTSSSIRSARAGFIRRTFGRMPVDVRASGPTRAQYTRNFDFLAAQSRVVGEIAIFLPTDIAGHQDDAYNSTVRRPLAKVLLMAILISTSVAFSESPSKIEPMAGRIVAYSNGLTCLNGNAYWSMLIHIQDHATDSPSQFVEVRFSLPCNKSPEWLTRRLEERRAEIRCRLKIP